MKSSSPRSRTHIYGMQVQREGNMRAMPKKMKLMGIAEARIVSHIGDDANLMSGFTSNEQQLFSKQIFSLTILPNTRL